MSASHTPARLQAYDVSGAKDLIGPMADVWVDAYTDSPHQDDPWFSREQFLERLTGGPSGEQQGRGYLNKPDFVLVGAWAGSELVAFFYGFSLTARNEWLAQVQPPLPAAYVREDGQRSYAAAEIIVRRGWRRQHLATQMHDHPAVQSQPHERFVLSVEPDNAPAVTAYRKWGYQAVGTQSSPGFPVYSVMVLNRPNVARPELVQSGRRQRAGSTLAPAPASQLAGDSQQRSVAGHPR